MIKILNFEKYNDVSINSCAFSESDEIIEILLSEFFNFLDDSFVENFDIKKVKKGNEVSISRYIRDWNCI